MSLETLSALSHVRTSREKSEKSKSDALETLQGIELPGAIWRALYLLALKRIRRRDRALAERLCAEARSCLADDRRAIILSGHEWGGERARSLERWMKGREGKRLAAPRPYRESLEGLYSSFRLVGEKLRRTPRKSWPNHVEDYWFLLGEGESRIPQNDKDSLKTNLATITSASEAALFIVGTIKGREPEALRTQFARKRWSLRVHTKPRKL